MASPAPGDERSVLESPAAATPPPNLILISIDTLRADHMGIYGYERDTTPEIDSFFAKGSIYENAMTTAPCTRPAVRQYLSGIYREDSSFENLAERLATAGYATAAFVSQHQFHTSQFEHYARGFEIFDVQRPDEVDLHGLSTRRASVVSDRALRWLDTRNDSAPFFLWLHYFDPHDPYDPPAPYHSFDAGNTSTIGRDRRQVLKALPRESQTPWMCKGDVFEAADVAHFINLYDGEIQYTDHQVGRVFRKLNALDLVDQSVVIFTADHGESLGLDGVWDHCWELVEGVMRVPFLALDLGGPLGGPLDGDLPVSTLDIVPTFLNRTGIAKADARHAGSDLKKAASDRVVIGVWQGTRAVRDRQHKLILGRAVNPRLYDIGSDPGERTNLADRDPATVRKLSAELRKNIEILNRAEAEARETRRQLKAIGYIE